MIKILFPVLAALAAMVLFLNKPAAQRQPTIFETRQNNEGDVEIAVTPQTMTIGKPVSLTVSLNTHSVPLEFELPAISALTDNEGTSLGTASWNGTPPGGHHRNGTLTFPDPLPKKTQAMTLTLTNISGIATRSFEWEVTAQ